MEELSDQSLKKASECRVARYVTGGSLDELGASDKVKRYTEYFVETRPALKAYLSSFLGANDEAIEDCVQETGMLVWNKWDGDWDLDSFQKFSFVTARFKALSWLKKHKPARHLVLSPAAMESLAEKSLEIQQDERLDLLQQCIEQLKPEHREVLEARYEAADSKALGLLAKKMGRSVDAVYKQLERLRTVLRDCVSRKIKTP